MSLWHAELKAGRALEHLEELKRELQVYYDAVPCPATLWKRPDIGRRFLRFDFKDLPDRTYLLVGDFAHNLRASLDYVVYTLIVKATGNPPASTGIQWPVQKTKYDGNFKRQTKDVPKLAADLIR